jgi:hypothetical protein
LPRVVAMAPRSWLIRSRPLTSDPSTHKRNMATHLTGEFRRPGDWRLPENQPTQRAGTG